MERVNFQAIEKKWQTEILFYNHKIGYPIVKKINLLRIKQYL